MNSASVIAFGTVILGLILASEAVLPLWEEYPDEDCRDIGQIVGRKCELSYFVCDFGDVWATKEVLCNNCIGDCPPGRVFDNITEVCVWPSTIGCGCTKVGEILGTKCEDRYYVCELLNEDWSTQEILCADGTVFDPETNSCKLTEDLDC